MKLFQIGLATSLLSLTLLCLNSCSDDEERYVRPDPNDGSPWVLVDVYHTTKQNPVDYKLEPGVFSYQGVFGFWRAFDHMAEHGYKWTSLHTEPFSRERLDGFDSVFINLVSDDRPDFTQKEVDVIIEYVAQGGGLFVIADHTNVYRHAERINRFLMPMGIEVLYHTVTDRPPVHAVSGSAWIMTRDFADHPVTRGLDMVSLQTGGPLSSESGVAFTSPCEETPPRNCSYADYWDPEDDRGFYGNWTWDGDEELEPVGPLEVVTAHEYGEGRIVVVGDQNIFGDAWIHFGDNFRLFMNATDWVSKKSDDREWLADIRPRGLNIAMPAPLSSYSYGKESPSGHLAFFVNANRDLEVSTKAVEVFNDEDDVAMILDPVREPTDAELDTLEAYLEQGKRVVLMFEADELNEASLAIIERLAPDFSLQSGEITADASDPSALLALDYERTEGVSKMDSRQLNFASTYRCGEDVDCVEPDKIASFLTPGDDGFLLDVSSPWGEPFLQAGSSDIARVKRVSNGELIIFVQNRFFRQRTMGSYLRSPSDQPPHTVCEASGCLRGLRSAHELQFSLLNYLKTPISDE